MKEVSINYSAPNTGDPETIARWVFSQIGEMLQRVEWIGQLKRECAKLGIFDEPIWTPDQCRLARKLRSMYAHDVQRIGRNGEVYLYNKNRKHGPKEARRTLSQLAEDWANMHVLVHETLVGYLETRLECKTCGIVTYGTNIPDCGHCVAPTDRNGDTSLITKPEGANLQITVGWGRADGIDEFVNNRHKMTLADGAWQIMMETGEFPKADTATIGDGFIPEDQKPNFLRVARPIDS